MNLNRWALPALCTLLLTGCGMEPESAPATPEVSATPNTLLDYVGSDTPYLAGTLAPVPADIIDAYLAKMQPVLDELQNAMSAGREQLENGEESDMQLALALLTELDGRLSRQGLAELGVDISSHHVVYGMGAFPVVRVALSDSAVLRATVERILQNSGLPNMEQEHQGTSFWRLSDGPQADAPAGLYAAILDDHLALSIFPPTLEAELLPAFLGQEKPANSNAAQRLADVNQSYGFLPYGTGLLDLHRMADEFMSPDSGLGRVMASHSDDHETTFSEVCRSEIHGIIDNAPMIVAGGTELTDSAVAYQFRVQSPSTLASELMGLVSRVPAVSAMTQRVLEVSLGVRVGAIRDFLRTKATAIVEAPYQCEHLAQFNDGAQQALTQLNEPMPPFVNNFRGVRASIESIDFSSQNLPADTQGHLAVHVEKPEMFVGMAQMFLPDLADLNMVAGEPPVAIPQSLMPAPGMVAWAMMTPNSIGLAVGEGEEPGLPAFMEREEGPEGQFMSLSYDMAAFMEQELQHQNDGYDHSHVEHHEDEEHRAVEAQVHALHSVFTETVKGIVDRSETRMTMTAEGLVVDGRTTFK